MYECGVRTSEVKPRKIIDRSGRNSAGGRAEFTSNFLHCPRPEIQFTQDLFDVWPLFRTDAAKAQNSFQQIRMVDVKTHLGAAQRIEFVDNLIQDLDDFGFLERKV
jgi:hypothetical protein